MKSCITLRGLRIFCYLLHQKRLSVQKSVGACPVASWEVGSLKVGGIHPLLLHTVFPRPKRDRASTRRANEAPSGKEEVQMASQPSPGTHPLPQVATNSKGQAYRFACQPGGIPPTFCSRQSNAAAKIMPNAVWNSNRCHHVKSCVVEPGHGQPERFPYRNAKGRPAGVGRAAPLN